MLGQCDGGDDEIGNSSNNDCDISVLKLTMTEWNNVGNNDVLLMDDIGDMTRIIVMIMLIGRWLNDDRDDVKVVSMDDNNENEEGNEYSDCKAPGLG